MRNQRQASINNSPPSPTFDYIRIPFHERTGDDFLVYGKNGSTVFDPVVDSSTAGKTFLAINGAPTDAIWTANHGHITPEGDNYKRLDADADVTAILTPDASTKAGMMFLFKQFQASGRVQDSGNKTLLQYGSEGAQGGWRINFVNGATLQYQLIFRANDAAGTFAQKNIASIGVDQSHTMFAWCDFTTQVGGLVVGEGGTLDTTVSADRNSDNYPLSAVSPDEEGIWILSGASRVGGVPTAKNFIGVNLTQGIHDLVAISFSTFPTVEQRAEIVRRYNAAPYELDWMKTPL